LVTEFFFFEGVKCTYRVLGVARQHILLKVKSYKSCIICILVFLTFTIGNGQRSANGKKSRKTVNKGVQQNSTESFQVSRSVELHLSHAPLTPFDILPLRFYSEFIWVMDFTLTTAFGSLSAITGQARVY